MENKSGEIHMNGGKGICRWIRDGAILLKKYEGDFTGQAIQDKADTGLWYCSIMGNPHSCEGEGPTPEHAIQDSIVRNNELQKLLNQANTVLGTFQL